MADPLEEYVREELGKALAANGNDRALADAVAELKVAQVALQTAEEHLLSLAERTPVGAKPSADRPGGSGHTGHDRAR